MSSATAVQQLLLAGIAMNRRLRMLEVAKRMVSVAIHWRRPLGWLGSSISPRFAGAPVFICWRWRQWPQLCAPKSAC